MIYLYAAKFPVEVEISVSVRTTAGGRVLKIASKRAVLGTPGQELTVLRFSLDGEGHVVPGSIHDLPRPLRSA